MELAGRAGVDPAGSRSLPCAGKKVLLVERFDLLPNVGQNSEQILAIDNRFVAPDRQALLREAKSFGLKQRQKAEVIIDEVWAQLQAWEEVFATCAVPPKDKEIIGRDITSRLRRGGAGTIAR